MTNGEKYLKVSVKEFFSAILNSQIDISGLYSLEKWLLDEVKPILTEEEKVILRNVPSDKKYIGKHDGGFILQDKLYISSGSNADNWARFPFDHLFKFIDIGEEYEIKELLK